MPNWFGNLLPEGQLRSLIGSELRLPETDNSSVHTEAMLLSALGSDMPGAVTISEVDHDGSPLERHRREPITDNAATALNPDVLRFSIAGVGIKFSLSRVGRQFTGPARGGDGDWLLKMPDKVFPELPRNEYAMMRWARGAGIDVPEVELVERDRVEGVPEFLWSSETVAYAISRFDRSKAGRIHVEDLAQVRGVSREAKYDGNYETAASLIYRRFDLESLAEFIRRLSFNVFIRNDDAHLKNWSLIYEDAKRPKIAPAYDIVSSAPYPHSGLSRDLGLKLGGSRRYENLSLDSFRRIARKLNADIDAAEIVNEVAVRMADTLEEVRSEADGSHLDLIVSHYTHMRRQIGV